MNDIFTTIFKEIKQDPMNHSFTSKGIDPLYFAGPEATVLIIGQAPGKKAEQSRLYWNDASGDRLRNWIGMSRKEFYTSNKLAILPMDFYFPGKGKSGDLPPRKEFAKKWHPRLIEAMPKLQLIILVGSYATHHYLQLKTSIRLTDIVSNYDRYYPPYFPLIHPSPRNQIWMKKNPWFENTVLPSLKTVVQKLI
ncbi:uracil-DNA glycosylase [Vagococcus penaei]|uniref:Uracil-DNA glycosylase n=1 Tax=Vagococcus penaei TaxID=633807 RepID=A0A1Q2D3I8_9ENTE|nr:uracil-DNA glycosylase family protein [Vagococcus penaei]AQP52881.1 uracil-DNA glycosylase [Vagococcus penaei]RSU01370.1 uracil-DNA glycosylase [Vagococcus penaei]